MIRIGLIGEDPNDTSSFVNLFQGRYRKRVRFFTLARNIRGFQLDNPKVRRMLPVEFKSNNCDFVIYIRDLDGFKSDESRIHKKKKWFRELDATINNFGILMLNIWELEALIFADIDTFNMIYGINYKYSGDPMVIKEPKEQLMKLTQKTRNCYRESHCPNIFLKLNFENLEKRCSYFKSFVKELDMKLKPVK